jgi:hypothetical protein
MMENAGDRPAVRGAGHQVGGVKSGRSESAVTG